MLTDMGAFGLRRHGCLIRGVLGFMDKGSALVDQGGAAVGTCKGLCSVGRGDHGTEC